MSQIKQCGFLILLNGDHTLIQYLLYPCLMSNKYSMCVFVSHVPVCNLGDTMIIVVIMQAYADILLLNFHGSTLKKVNWYL